MLPHVLHRTSRFRLTLPATPSSFVSSSSSSSFVLSSRNFSSVSALRLSSSFSSASISSSFSSVPIKRRSSLLSSSISSTSSALLNSSSLSFKKKCFSSSSHHPSSVPSNQVEKKEEEREGQGQGQGQQQDKAVGTWLLICGGMVFAMVVIGGVTRLTESGLSITEWKPITGAIPPLSSSDWEEEFAKYTSSPEYRKMNLGMSLEEFKKIFFWEYIHRLWGRTIGLAWAAPFVYWTVKGRIRVGSKLFSQCLAIGTGIGLQGALGWFMVKSGLEEPEENTVPRVSPYRLASHLSAAIALYAGFVWVGLGLVSPRVPKSQLATEGGLGQLRRLTQLTLGLTATTILSGAFVAGRDAGLVYNNFPKMGDDWIPDEAYSLQPFWKNFFENDASVQLHHRVLAMTTLCFVLGVWALGNRRLRAHPRAKVALHGLLAATIGQVTLGITTLVMLVPVHLGAAHQAGSLTLLTVLMWLLHNLRKIRK